jgi:hypothetical protein
MAALTFFTVNAYSFAMRVDYIDVDTDPDLQPISATVEFKPRLSKRHLLQAPTYTTPALIALAPVKARLDEDGVLKTIQGDVGVKLVANTPVLGLGGPLIYDVWFSNVVYNKSSQGIDPFGFYAPTASSTVNLASVTKLPIDPAFVNS